MLKIVFGEMENVFYGPGWFVNNYEQEWLSDPLVMQMIEDVDKSVYRSGELIESTILGPISPRDLSGGVKTLISIYKEPDRIFDATSCGNNCARWLIEIGNRIDVTINLKYPMTFEGLEPFEIFVSNDASIVTTEHDYILKAVTILHKEPDTVSEVRALRDRHSTGYSQV